MLIVHTGGTFGMLPGGDRFARGFRTLIPELSRIAACKEVTPFRLDSSSMEPEHWVVLARILEREMPRFDGFVVTHGTDTLAYTASALSFLLEGLQKPVILTGAQRPFVEIRTDARSNIVDSVEVATDGPPEVAIVFGGIVLRGNRARKRSLTDYRAFESPNFPPLAEVGTTVERHRERWRRARGRFRLRPEVDPRVVHLRLSPGIVGSSLAGFETNDVRGVVVEAFGAGNFPDPKGPDPALARVRRLTDAGVPVVVVSGSEHGAVDLSLYAGGRAGAKAGVIPGGDLTAEAAVVKLMVALGRDPRMAAVRRFMSRDVAGELTTRP